MEKFVLIIKFLLFCSQSVTSSIVSDMYSNEDSMGFRSGINNADQYIDKFNQMTRLSIYDKFARPGHSKNDSLPVFVNVSLDLIAMTAFDESDSEYTISLKMDLEWFDDRLKYESNRTDAMTVESYLYERIWYPRLRVPNIKEPGSLELNGQSNVILFKTGADGYVFIRTTFQLNLWCILNFKNYPFDLQKCSIMLESRDYSNNDLILRWNYDNPFQNSDRFNLAAFSLLDYSLFNDSVKTEDEEENVSRIRVELHLKRDWYHFLLDVYLPSALFVIMSWLSFWLEICAAPARITLGMTTMLTLVTSSQFSREKLPKVPYIHAMDLWIAFCICFVFASLIEYTFVSYLYQSDKHKRERQKSLQRDLSALSLASMATTSISQYLDIPEIPKNKISLTIPNLAANLRRLSAESSSTSDYSEMESLKKCSDRKKHSFFRRMFQIKCPNQELAQMIDRKCRLVFPLCFILFNIIYWTTVDV